MIFISLAVNNVKKNFNNYAMYLISAVFSVMIFYIFSSIAFNEILIKLADNKPIVKVIFKASAGIVALFSFVFIWYSIKKKKNGIEIEIEKVEDYVQKALFYSSSLLHNFYMGDSLK